MLSEDVVNEDLRKLWGCHICLGGFGMNHLQDGQAIHDHKDGIPAVAVA